MSNYPTAWHENMNYLKLLMSDKLSTVEVSVQQPPSVCNVGGIIKWESIKFCFPDKSSTPKEAENHLLRLGLHLMPVHALWPPKLQMSAVTLLWGVWIKASNPVAYIHFHVVSQWSFERGRCCRQTWWSFNFSFRQKQNKWKQCQSRLVECQSITISLMVWWWLPCKWMLISQT